MINQRTVLYFAWLFIAFGAVNISIGFALNDEPIEGMICSVIGMFHCYYHRDLSEAMR